MASVLPAFRRKRGTMENEPINECDQTFYGILHGFGGMLLNG